MFYLFVFFLCKINRGCGGFTPYSPHVSHIFGQSEIGLLVIPSSSIDLHCAIDKLARLRLEGFREDLEHVVESLVVVVPESLFIVEFDTETLASIFCLDT